LAVFNASIVMARLEAIPLRKPRTTTRVIGEISLFYVIFDTIEKNRAFDNPQPMNTHHTPNACTCHHCTSLGDLAVGLGRSRPI
jgi:hypothetical protein